VRRDGLQPSRTKSAAPLQIPHGWPDSSHPQPEHPINGASSLSYEVPVDSRPQYSRWVERGRAQQGLRRCRVRTATTWLL